ncbi:MAG: carboxypeptidase-like regulatory domain-containing protein [Bacteroidota bacterium]
MSQQARDRLSVNFKDLPLELVIDSIAYQTHYQFSYNSDIMPRGSLFTLKKQNIHVDTLLSILLVGTNLVYQRNDDLIILKKANVNSKEIPKVNIRTVSGWVRDIEGKKPISGVNVHLNGTMVGTSTDQYGNYEIKKIPPGSYELVFSYVGYEVVTHPLLVEEEFNQKVNALMQERVQELGGVELVSTRFVKEVDWERYFKKFKIEFLGKTQNASRCEILNPNVLNFTESEDVDVFSAEASQALIIQNDALGYKIIYDLLSFTKDPEGTKENGKVFFVSLTPENRKENRRWRNNRKKSYLGSINHFFISLIEGNYYRKGYRVYEISNPSDITSQNKTPIDAKKLVKPTSNPYEWSLDFDGLIMVEYTKEIESQQYVMEMNSTNDMHGIITSTLLDVSPNIQRSVLELRDDSVLLDRFGQSKKSFGIKIMGYWAWERVADMMPAGYDPKEDNLINK